MNEVKLTLDEFRIIHSTLIENYQYIEMQLEGIYASLCNKDFYHGLLDVDKTNLNKLLSLVREQEMRSGIRVINEDEAKQLSELFRRRNYWTHNCYTDMLFDRKTSAPSKKSEIDQLYNDLRDSEKIRELLYNRKMQLMKQELGEMI